MFIVIHIHQFVSRVGLDGVRCWKNELLLDFKYVTERLQSLTNGLRQDIFGLLNMPIDFIGLEIDCDVFQVYNDNGLGGIAGLHVLNFLYLEKLK